MTNLQSIRDDLIHAQAKIAGGRINLAEQYLRRVLSVEHRKNSHVMACQTAAGATQNYLQAGLKRNAIHTLQFMLSRLPNEQTKAGERHEPA